MSYLDELEAQIDQEIAAVSGTPSSPNVGEEAPLWQRSLQGASEKLNSFYWGMGNALSMDTMPTMLGAIDTALGRGGGDVLEQRNERQKQGDELRDKAPVAGFAGDLTGAIMGPSGAIAKGADDLVSAAGKSTPVRRIAAQGGAGILDSLVRDWGAGERDPSTLAANSALQGGAGAVGQGILGEAVPRTARFLTGGKSATVAQRGLTTARGSTKGGLSIDDLAGRKMNAGQGYLDQLEVSGDPALFGQATADTVGALSLPRDSSGGLIDDAIRQTDDYLARVNTEMTQRVNNVAGYQTEAMRKQRLDSALARPRKTFDDMLRISGGTKVGKDDVLAEVDRAFGRYDNLSTSERAAYSRLMQELDHFSSDTGDSVRLEQLVTLKKSIDEMFDPRANVGDAPLQREAQKKLSNLKRHIVDLIDSRTQFDYKHLNSEFADQYQIESAFEMGRSMLGNKFRAEEVAEWMRNADNNATKEAFREGFKDAFSTKIGQQGYFPAVRSLVGDLSKNGKVKPDNIRKLREVVGDDITDAIVEVAETYGPRSQAAEAMSTALHQKLSNPEGNFERGALLDIALSGGGLLGHSSRAAGAGATSRLINRPTNKSSTDIMSILGASGDEYNLLTNNLRNQIDRPNNIPTMGGIMAAAGSEGETQYDQPSSENELMLSLEEMLGLR